MELQYRGANCLVLKTKGGILITDPIVPGLKVDISRANIIALTSQYDNLPKFRDDQLVIDMPGEYESKRISVRGIATRGHMDEEGKQSVTMLKIRISDVWVLVTGHIYPELSDEQLETIGNVDVLCIPVGGNGYTLDSEGATKIIRMIEPKIIVPTHYSDKAIKYEVPQGDLKKFLDDLGAVFNEENKLEIKSGNVLPEQLSVITLKRTA